MEEMKFDETSPTTTKKPPKEKHKGDHGAPTKLQDQMDVDIEEASTKSETPESGEEMNLGEWSGQPVEVIRKNEEANEAQSMDA
jgi:hypothetical protein